MKFKKFLFLISIVLLLPIALIVLNLFDERAPRLFPFDDPEATYTIVKGYSGFYYINYKTISDRNKTFVCEWKDTGEKSCGWELNQEISGVFIGESPVDLEQFIGKNVTLSGEYEYTKEQCIVGKCRQSNHSAVALNIYSIKESK